MRTSPPTADGAVQAWQRVATEVVHKAQLFDLCVDDVIQPDGTRGTYVHVMAPAAVTVLALHDNDQVVLTKQWIYTHGGTEWRLPTGVVGEADSGPAAAAHRELARTTGLRAARWELIGEIHGADSLSNHIDHVFLADGLSEEPVSARLGARVHTMKFDDVVELVHQGRLPHAGSAHAVLAMALRRARHP